MTDEEKMTLGILAGHVFNPSSPINERDLFSGRIEQMRNVFDVVFQKGQHAIIYGERGVGKTSLANVLTQFFPEQQGSLPSIRINCDATDSFQSVWKKVFSKLELVKQKSEVGFTRATSITSTELITPEYFFHGKEINPESVRGALMSAGIFLRVVILDEFDRLDEPVKKVFADLIKNLSDNAVENTIILIGVGGSVDEIIKEHQSVTRALKQILMPRMTNDEIKSIINTGLTKLHMTIVIETLNQIALLCQGLPHYAHLIGLFATRDAIDNNSLNISAEHLTRAIEKAINGCQQTIKTAYHQGIRSAHKDSIFAEVLLSCALAHVNDLGEFAAQDVCEPLGKIMKKDYGIPSFARHLSEFTGEKHGKILVKYGESRRIRYKFSDPLMQPFVIMQGILSGKIEAESLA